MPKPDLLEENKDDHHTTFTEYLAANHQRIYSYIVSLLPNRADAEDAFQQTSLTLWTKFSDFDHTREFYPWACRFAFYTVANFRRSADRRQLCYSDDALRTISDKHFNTDGAVADHEGYLEDCLAMLSSADRALIKQVYGNEASIQEIAKSTNRAVQTIYNRLNRIRHRLCECIDRKANGGGC